ncbi:ATP-binding protein [Streptomyces sp. VNUA24]|uniref:ATP-binding protein n=1 Tax=Streptomyces sp. VNUA24 TaxID=3031131 RepID=UPI0023B85466|nr:ATP-binding protein [Streptomyces sp. VNUA24]WEH12210.1 ATP-binding protein [Streptomyces sp. VNUA24]
MGVSVANFAAAKITASVEGLAHAREFTRYQLQRWGVPGATDDVISVMAELAGNALRHTAAADEGTWMALGTSPRTVVCIVLDPSPGKPALRPADNLSTAGRGLNVVSALSTAWGWSPQGQGKAVWARVPL